MLVISRNNLILQSFSLRETELLRDSVLLPDGTYNLSQSIVYSGTSKLLSINRKSKVTTISSCPLNPSFLFMRYKGDRKKNCTLYVPMCDELFYPNKWWSK